MATNTKFINIDEYIDLLKDKTTICVKDYKKHHKGVIVRHDIDYSLEMAYEFSRYEKLNKINSTYYILLTSNVYNIFSYSSQKIIKQMISDGFEIGLHFDPLAYGDLGEKNDYLKKMTIEIEMFEEFYGKKIYSYSMHNPFASGIYLNNPELINAYDARIFSNENYISDSAYSFRGKNPKEFLLKSENELIQFLTHPIHFFGSDNITYEKQLNSILNNYYKKIDEIWNVNNVYSDTKNKYQLKIFKRD